MECVRMVALIALGSIAQAATAADQGFYFGLSAGQARYDFAFEPPRVVAFAEPSWNVPPGGPVAQIPFPAGAVRAYPLRSFWLPGEDDETTGWGGFVGYRIVRYAAIELAYVDLGTLHEYQPEIFFTPTIRIPELRSDLSTRGPAVSALAIVPVGEKFELFLRGGMLFADQKVSHVSAGFTERTTYGSEAWLFGAGAQYNFGSHWAARLDFQRYDSVGEDNGIGESDIDVWSLGVIYRL